MFSLEQSIAEWRKQMLAAGIKTPVPLEELECHLREEIERQIQAGVDPRQAFEMTVSQIGQAQELKTEFSKDAGLFGHNKFAMMNRILGTLWLILCSFAFFRVCSTLGSHPHFQGSGQAATFYLVVSSLFAAYGVGLLGSIFVIGGSKLGRRTLGIIASYFTLVSVFILFSRVPTIQPLSVLKIIVFTAFYVITAWLMFRPPFIDANRQNGNGGRYV